MQQFLFFKENKDKIYDFQFDLECMNGSER